MKGDPALDQLEGSLLQLLSFARDNTVFRRAIVSHLSSLHPPSVDHACLVGFLVLSTRQVRAQVLAIVQVLS